MLSIIIFFFSKNNLWLYIVGYSIVIIFIIKLIDKYYFSKTYNSEEIQFDKALSTTDKNELDRLFQMYSNTSKADGYFYQAQIEARLGFLEDNLPAKLLFFSNSSLKLVTHWLDTMKKPSSNVIKRQINKVVKLRGIDKIPKEFLDQDTIHILYKYINKQIQISEINNSNATKFINDLKL